MTTHSKLHYLNGIMTLGNDIFGTPHMYAFSYGFMAIL